MPAPPLSAVLRRVVAALLLAAGVACAGGSAQAGCGDYLTIDGKPHAGRDHMPAKPCDGPNCTAAPAPTPVPLTAPAPLTAGAKDTAAGPQLAGEDPSPTLGFSRPVSDGRSVHVPRS